MTDRIKGFTVVLDKDYRDDEVDQIANAIRMIVGVKAVKNHIANSNDWMNRERIRREIVTKIYEALEGL